MPINGNWFRENPESPLRPLVETALQNEFRLLQVIIKRRCGSPAADLRRSGASPFPADFIIISDHTLPVPNQEPF